MDKKGVDFEEGKDMNDRLDEHSPNKEHEDTLINEVDGWYEIRLLGKLPERRSYHSTAVHKD
jgi:hypothetical protein